MTMRQVPWDGQRMEAKGSFDREAKEILDWDLEVRVPACLLSLS